MRQIVARLEKFVNQLEGEQCEKYLAQIEAIRQRMDYPDMKLAVIGNFSCGKSTFLNAVLKTSLLAMDNMPTTAVPTYIDWNGKKGKQIVTVLDAEGVKHPLDQNGRKWFLQTAGKDLPEDMGAMLDYLTTTNELTHIVSKISISFPRENGHNGFCIVDTPGVNPGNEEAADHIIKTQSVLREEADAAIVLFPSYCVYTRDFQEFLDQNAKHLLADSIFVVTKMDQVPSEKERDKLIHFVKGRLEQNFGLENPEVFGCSAGRALDYYAGHTDDKDPWADSFEQMLESIFGELTERRKRIVTEKTKKMMESLICELQVEIKRRQEALLKTKKNFAIYSYDNLKNEYKSGLVPYYQAIQIMVNKERKEMECIIREKTDAVFDNLKMRVYSAMTLKRLKELIEVFQNEMKESGEVFEKLFFVSMQRLNGKMNEKYEGLITAMQGLLKRYQYNVGEFETFAYGKIKIEAHKNLPTGQLKGGSQTIPSELADWGAITDTFFAAFGDLFGGLCVQVSVLTGAWGGMYLAVIRQQQKKIMAQIGEKIEEYVVTVMQQYDERAQRLQKRYNEAGERLLMEYTKEYKIFFEEKERQMEMFRIAIEAQIKKNEQRIAGLDELTQDVSNARMEEAKRTILFLGGVNAGKTTLINAILREDLLETSVLPCTTMITKISYGMDQRVKIITDTICRQNGTAEEILSREEWRSRTPTLQDFEDFEYLNYPMDRKTANLYSPNMPPNICMVDTPGLLSGLQQELENRRAHWELIATSDAVVFVMDVRRFLTMTDKEEIKEILRWGFDKENIWFVFNRMDLLSGTDQKATKKEIYRWLSFVYEDKNGNYDKQLYNQRVFFVSAYNACKIRIENKSDMTEEETGVPALERSLKM